MPPSLRTVVGDGPLSPGALANLRQNQHGQVAANSIGEVGELEKLPLHRLPEARMAVVELEGVGPTGERIPARGQDIRAATGLHLPVIVGVPLQVGGASLNIELGGLLNPGVTCFVLGYFPHPGRVRTGVRTILKPETRTVAP
jgi:hypothetical protein